MRRVAIVLLAPVVFCSFVQRDASVFPPEEWSRDYAPFRLAGNLYYVGTYDLASYLLTTPEGHILINTGHQPTGPMIRKHVEALGFKFSDIKILLATHAHFDHVGAMAWVQKQTGAALMIQELDAPLVADGGRSDYVLTGEAVTFEPVKAARLLHDGDTVQLGGQRLVLLHHPGHTKGASSFVMDIQDGPRRYRTLIANMPSVLDETHLSGMKTYPHVGQDYANTIKAMKALQFDLWFASHGSQFHLHKKRQPGDAYRPEAFMDRKGYDAELEELEQAYRKKLAAEH